MAKSVSRILLPILSFALCYAPASGQESNQSAEISGSPHPRPIRRVALIIANQDYTNGPQVSTAYADAEAVTKKLSDAHFDVVKNVPGVQTKDQMVKYIKDLANAAGPPDEPAIILFYFAGHGFQSGPWPFLIPTNADPQNLYEDSLSLSKAVELLGNHDFGLAIFIVDACRTIETPALRKLAGDQASAPSVSLSQASTISFSGLSAKKVAVLHLSTEYGELALNQANTGDGLSPYAHELTSLLPSSRTLVEVFGYVHTNVLLDTADHQEPVLVMGANISHFYINPPVASQSAEGKVWESALQTQRTKCIKAFAMDYPGSDYVKAAVSWLGDRGIVGADEGNQACPQD